MAPYKAPHPGDCVAIFCETFWDFPVTQRSKKLATGYCLRRPAFVLRPPPPGTPLRCAPRDGSHTDLTAFRMPYVLSPPPLALRLRQNIRPYAYAGVVVHRSTAIAVSASCTPSMREPVNRLEGNPGPLVTEREMSGQQRVKPRP